jgi:hypothetical protein
MFKVNDDLSIYATRGDTIAFAVAADASGSTYKFKDGDIVRFKAFEKKGCENVVLQKDFPAEAGSETVSVLLTGDETKLGECISKPKDYWYEIELNPETKPQTIVGYDEDGAKVFRLYPEGGEME